MAETIRCDKWLWHARFFKTRGRASAVLTGGHLRLNTQHVHKPSTAIRVGDTLTFLQEKEVRVIRVEALSTRRGPASEAATLYRDLAPVQPREKSEPQARKGRIHKKDRRAGRISKEGTLE